MDDTFGAQQSTFKTTTTYEEKEALEPRFQGEQYMRTFPVERTEARTQRVQSEPRVVVERREQRSKWVGC